ncbi:MAG: hypothetical protein ACI3W5_10115, partial [Faecousia sp.]
FDRERDEWQDTPLCNLCVHKRPGIKCDAFPEGIPMGILRSGEHFLPVEGDHGIVFERRD